MDEGCGWGRGVREDALPLGLDEFRELVLTRGLDLYRDLPWRRTTDPYAVWVSEVMLQQTQVSRVDGRWQRWLERFPDVESLARADTADVLQEWQGLGYNRRALALRQAAVRIFEMGEFPREEQALQALPGIGPATAAGIRAFAFDLPGVYLETNVRTVFIHELFPDEDKVSDGTLIPLVGRACLRDDARMWYYALLDYGAHLKQVVANPSRRSSTHVRQSRFEGSHRQRRAEVVRILLDHRGRGASFDDVREALCATEASAGRAPVADDEVALILSELAREGFCHEDDGHWSL